ncbi:hypothetical protein E2C01_027572 [Portunus trituberculatus]|uniref:Uncharacterized protein n=1 Tax=Portunus trituberculatus TaxID=210409 RepID=A0A5B7EIG4_PORTR|nr:hypothetical protein [Portunus trituberculatus]
MLREVSRHFGSPPREQSNLGTFLVPSPEEDSEARFGISAVFPVSKLQLKGACVLPGVHIRNKTCKSVQVSTEIS